MNRITKNIISIIIITVFLYAAINCNKEDPVSGNGINDLGILRTNELGQILGGDYTDWCLKPDTMTYMAGFNVTQVSYYVSRLNWTTRKEYHNYGFDVERCNRNDSTNCIKIGFVSGKNITNDSTNYIYWDSLSQPASNFKYRLKMIDNFGNYEYFYPGIFIYLSPGPSFGPVYPNPTDGSYTIKFTIHGKDTISLYLCSYMDTVYILKNEIFQAGTYEIQRYDPYHLMQKRLYIISKTLPFSDSCRNYGDIQFE